MKKIANKSICLLLTFVLLLGILPLAGLGTLRAKAANAGETAITAADDADTASATLRAAAEPTWVEVGRRSTRIA